MLEDTVAKAYRRMALLIAEKELKPLLLYIAYDSFKHSRVLREMAKGLSAKVKADLEACLEQMGEAWKRTVESAEVMASRKKRIRAEELLTIIDRMEEIEGFAGEEYLMFINSRVLQVASLIGKRNLKLYKEALELIAEDEERHRSILSKIKEYLLNKRAR
jgi:rubrerythrin